MEEFSSGLLNLVYTLFFYGMTLIPAFVVGTYIIGRDKDKRFSFKQIIALVVALIPFLFFMMN
jgi:hypothetical protein